MVGETREGLRALFPQDHTRVRTAKTDTANQAIENTANCMAIPPQGV